MEFPAIVTFCITSRCQYDCSYCYRKKGNKELGICKLRKIFALFEKKGVKAVVLTGGEPTLHNDFKEILEEIKKRNMKVFLDTHGAFFFKYREHIDKYVDILGLPIDSATADKSYRSRENFDTIIRILEYYKDKEKRPELRIGTVITRENINELEGIAELLKKYKIDSWKIYQFVPRGTNATINREKLEIDTKVFEEAAGKVKKEYDKYFKIIVTRIIDRVKAYFFLKPDGTVFMPNNDKTGTSTAILGHIFDEDIAEKWAKCASEDNYINNATVTFNLKLK